MVLRSSSPWGNSGNGDGAVVVTAGAGAGEEEERVAALKLSCGLEDI
jgi:hypothetical protein